VIGGTLDPAQSSAGQTLSITVPHEQRPAFNVQAYAHALANRPPVVEGIDPLQATVGEAFEFQIAASDPDAEALTYVIYQAPTGLAVSATGLVTWTPTPASEAISTVIIDVFDARGARTAASFGIVVEGVHPPVLSPLPAIIAGREGELLQVALRAYDQDGDHLVYGVENLPAGAIFDPLLRALVWTPGYNAAGTYPNVTFVASDGPHIARQSFTLLIQPTDQPPLLAAIANRTLQEGEVLRLQLSAFDPEGKALTYRGQIIPAGATVDPQTGVFEWTPSYVQHGVHELTFTVSDGASVVTRTATFTVLNVNAAPQFQASDAFAVAEGQELQVRALAVEPDNPASITYDADVELVGPGEENGPASGN
jgi:hypothetical protein